MIGASQFLISLLRYGHNILYNKHNETQDYMNIKEMLLVVGCALMTTWVIDYFILSRYRVEPVQGAQAGRQFNAPEDQHVVKPLNVDITFESKKKMPEVITEVTTDWADLSFSTQGAVLDRLEYKHRTDVQSSIITIHSGLKPKQKAFLVAFDTETPYYFTLVAKLETDTQVKIIYEAPLMAHCCARALQWTNKDAKSM